jgi:maltose alpha-D-glucosyltransferase/alpha-amylase
MFDFLLNHKIWLALARCDAEPLVEALKVGVRLPSGAQWVTFLRNHDELDLSRLTDEQRSDVFAAFAPEEDMRLYGRGIRRRLGPMLNGDRRHLELAYALQFSLPGTPVVRYGEELGMGEDLGLDGREAIRTPMPWDDGPNAGFSSAPPDQLARPVVLDGELGARKVNVRAQQRDPDSLLRWMQNLVQTLRLAPEIGTGTCTVVDVPLPRSVLAHRFDAPSGSILLLHNLADTAVAVDVGSLGEFPDGPYDLLVDGPYEAPTAELTGLALNGWGYRWIRLARSDRA